MSHTLLKSFECFSNVFSKIRSGRFNGPTAASPFCPSQDLNFLSSGPSGVLAMELASSYLRIVVVVVTHERDQKERKKNETRTASRDNPNSKSHPNLSVSDEDDANDSFDSLSLQFHQDCTTHVRIEEEDVETQHRICSCVGVKNCR